MLAHRAASFFHVPHGNDVTHFASVAPRKVPPLRERWAAGIPFARPFCKALSNCIGFAANRRTLLDGFGQSAPTAPTRF